MPGPIAKRRITQVIIEPAPVTAPSATNEALAFDGTPSAKTFNAFTDPDNRINNYVATINNTVGTTSVSGSGRGPYTFSGYSAGDTFTLVLTARDSSNRALASAVHTVSIEVEEIPPLAEVVAPASTSESVAWDATPSAKTFNAFTDPDNRITNYQAVIVNVVGTTSLSGSGLGPYTFSGYAPESSWTLKLNARDSENNILATAIHSVTVAYEPVVIPSVTAPAATEQEVTYGESPANKTFSAFTDTGDRISSYNSAVIDIKGTTSASGSGLGPYTFSGCVAGDAFVLRLNALDSEGNVLASTFHAVKLNDAPNTIVSAPSITSEDVAAGENPANKTFGSFTDPEEAIVSYTSSVIDIINTNSASGTGLGPYTYTSGGNGSSFIHKLEARASDSSVLAVAYHIVTIYPDPVIADSEVLFDLDWVALRTAHGSDYDFKTLGDATHTVGGVQFVLRGSSAFATLVLTTNGLELTQGGALISGLFLNSNFISNLGSKAGVIADMYYQNLTFSNGVAFVTVGFSPTQLTGGTPPANSMFGGPYSNTSATGKKVAIVNNSASLQVGSGNTGHGSWAGVARLARHTSLWKVYGLESGEFPASPLEPSPRDTVAGAISTFLTTDKPGEFPWTGLYLGYYIRGVSGAITSCTITRTVWRSHV